MRTTWRRPILALVTCLALAVPVAASVAPASAAPADTMIRINEVESNGGTPGDWVELTNISGASVDASGLILRDNVDSDTFTIPAGSIIAPGGFLVLDVESAYGLGGTDNVRLFLADGVTPVDSYSWTGHASSTYGRMPDGTGAFVQTVSTRGAANQTTVVVPVTPNQQSLRINEIESSGGTPGDWVELTNIGTVAVDAAGMILRDNVDSDTFTIPASSTIAPGAFLAFDVESAYGLGGTDNVRLFLADGTTAVDSYSWTGHATTTYGRFPDGTGPFVTTTVSTKNAANQAAVTVPTTPTVRVNEVESSGGTPGDWAELFNYGTSAVDISGWLVKDSDDTHIFTIPAATSIAAGGFYVAEVETAYGLGSPDSVRIFLPNGTLVDQQSWTPHATTTYGICGTAFVTTTSSTKGAVNDCSSPLRINEIESSGGTPGDWVELKNTGAVALDASGFVITDNDATHRFTIPAATSIAAGGYYVADVATFGLGDADSVRLYAANGSTLLDSYDWTAAASTTYGRCPDGTGAFATTAESTRGAANFCVGDLVTAPWPGSQNVQTADVAGTFAGNLSGLAYEATPTGNVLWGAQNGPGSIFRMVNNGTNWVPDTTNGWSAGKALHYTDGTGDVDAEGITLTGAGAAGGAFVASERNNSASGVSRLSVLRYDVTSAASSLTATKEWNLTADLPAVGANVGLEAIAWVPDTFLTAGGFFDQSTNAVYNPNSYADHGSGLFFVGVEAGGTVYGYALNQVTGAYTRVATITSGFAGVMDLEFDAETGSLWAVCDDTCNGRSTTLTIGAGGLFAPSSYFERPTGMPNYNNEGFAMAPQSQCVSGAKTVFWADDTNDNRYSIRTGSINCTVVVPSDPNEPGLPDPGTPAPSNPGATTPVAPEQLTEAARGGVDAPASARPGDEITIAVGVAHAGETVDVWMYSTPVFLGAKVVSAAGTVRVVIPADAPVGAHRLAVLAADGTLIGWDTITVAALRSSALAATGAEVNTPLIAGGLLLLVGAGLLGLRGRRVDAR